MPDSLSDKSLKLQWKSIRRKDLKYKVQWKLENDSGIWEYCQRETWFNDSTIQLNNLRPYTNYQVPTKIMLHNTTDGIYKSNYKFDIFMFNNCV